MILTLSLIYVFFRFGYIFIHIQTENNFFQSLSFYYFVQEVENYIVIVAGAIIFAKYIAFVVRNSKK
jgi:hypothetical protein